MVFLYVCRLSLYGKLANPCHWRRGGQISKYPWLLSNPILRYSRQFDYYQIVYSFFFFERLEKCFYFHLITSSFIHVFGCKGLVRNVDLWGQQLVLLDGWCFDQQFPKVSWDKISRPFKFEVPMWNIPFPSTDTQLEITDAPSSKASVGIFLRTFNSHSKCRHLPINNRQKNQFLETKNMSYSM